MGCFSACVPVSGKNCLLRRQLEGLSHQDPCTPLSDDMGDGTRGLEQNARVKEGCVCSDTFETPAPSENILQSMFSTER